MRPAVRYELEDCIDLPPITVSTREVEMSAAQKAAYKTMKEAFYANFHEGEITALNAGVQTSKLLQIGAGFTYGQNELVVDLPHEPRIKELREIIDSTEHNVIVFTPFKHSVALLEKQLSKTYTVAAISGDVPKSQRDKIFNRFQHGNDLKVIVAHPQCMSHGLTLTAASHIIWYSPTPNLETYEQASARIRRPGQDKHTHIVHLQSSPIEKRIYKVLEQRGSMQEALLDLFRAELEK